MDPKEEIGRIFKAARGDLSQEAAATLLGVKQSHISKVERGAAPPSRQLVDKLARHLGADKKRLMDLLREEKGFQDEDPATSPPATIEVPKRSEGFLPVVGKAACGDWIEALEERRAPSGEEWMEYWPNSGAGPQAFVIRATGASMIGSGIEEGDLLLVDPEAALENGRIALVRWEGKVTVKIFRDKGDYIELAPANPDPKYRKQKLEKSKAEFADEGGVAYRVKKIRSTRDA